MAEAGARLRARLVRRIARTGALKDPAWRAAFSQVPRHLFVPVYHQSAGSGYETLRADDPDPERRARWLAGAYEDVPLVTHVGGDAPLSSSSQPSLMAMMLDALEVREGDALLEIGAGTGYNAALMSHRLGDALVTTVDLEEEITAVAREHLAAAGYRPAVLTGDGAAGYEQRAPYDRVMATCAVPSIPVAWLRQCRSGALVLTPLASGLVKLEVGRADGGPRAEGRFLATPAYFVAFRGPGHGVARSRGEAGGSGPAGDPEHPERAGEREEFGGREEFGERERSTDTGPRALGSEAFRFVLGLAAGELDVRWSFDTARHMQGVTLRAPDGATARVGRGGKVTVAGPRDLWALVEEIHDLWQGWRRPTRERFGVTVEGESQWIWLDDPAGDFTWSLPSVF